MALKIGFLGGGKMAQALANGFLAKGLTKGENLIASAAPQDKQCFQAFKALGGTATSDNIEVVKESRVVFLSVKPDIATTILQEVSNETKPHHLFISICMGVPLSTLQKALPPYAKVIRAMPNTPALIGSGASVFALGNKVTREDAVTAQTLLSSVGLAEQVPEKWIDPVTGLSGSGPAYVSIYCQIERLVKNKEKENLPISRVRVTKYGTGTPLMCLCCGIAEVESLGQGEAIRAWEGVSDLSDHVRLTKNFAQVLMTIESLADGGVQQGLPRDLALRLAAQTVLGTGKMALESDQHPAKLRDDVTSPAGSTAAGLAHLEKFAVRSAFQGAVEAAVNRCREMAAQASAKE